MAGGDAKFLKRRKSEVSMRAVSVSVRISDTNEQG